jgi:hypothetical protein
MLEKILGKQPGTNNLPRDTTASTWRNFLADNERIVPGGGIKNVPTAASPEWLKMSPGGEPWYADTVPPTNTATESTFMPEMIDMGTPSAGAPALAGEIGGTSVAPELVGEAGYSGVGGTAEAAADTATTSGASSFVTPAVIAYALSKAAELTSETKEVPQEVSEIGSTIASVFEAPVKAVQKIIDCGIIMTAVHGSNSPEVEVCRKYKRFMTPAQLRGYYVFAEPACYVMAKHPAIKPYFRKHLTMRFVDYALYRLGERKAWPRLLSFIVSKAFLGMCGYLGRKVSTYTRENGEVF